MIDNYPILNNLRGTCK